MKFWVHSNTERRVERVPMYRVNWNLKLRELYFQSALLDLSGLHGKGHKDLQTVFMVIISQGLSSHIKLKDRNGNWGKVNSVSAHQQPVNQP